LKFQYPGAPVHPPGRCHVRSRLENVVRQRRDLERCGEALRQGFKGWTDETMAMVGEWDFDVADVGVHVDWWHGANDKTVPLRRFSVWQRGYRTSNCTSSMAVLTTSTWQHSRRERGRVGPQTDLGCACPTSHRVGGIPSRSSGWGHDSSAAYLSECGFALPLLPRYCGMPELQPCPGE
jgi:hypothetical protein